MFKVTKYKNVKSPEIESTLDIEDVFKIIKEGDCSLKHIEDARTYDRGNEVYDLIKTNLIPTFRFNFLFNGKATNKDLTEPTGLIYIDVDNSLDIPDSDLIFAKWKSISLMGWGILVKVQNLTVESFNNCYDEISLLLKLDSDTGARKPTQQTVQSYDPNIYINPNSKTFNCLNIKKVPFPIKQKKRKECLDRNETFFPFTQHIKVRFNNIGDYFMNNDEPYIVFKEDKEKLCIPFIPQKVEKGNRNRYLYNYISQILALNPYINIAYITELADSVNSNAMKPPLVDTEIQGIINSLFRLKELGELTINYNKERRIIFNPNQKLDFKEIMNIVNKELGKITRVKTAEKIYEFIEEWDFDNYGKITQLKLVDLTQLSPSTIKRYWHNFKSHIKELNNDYKGLNTNVIDMEIDCSINYSTYYISDPLWKKSA